MKGSIVPIKPEVVVKVIECGPLRIGATVPMSKIKGVPKN